MSFPSSPNNGDSHTIGSKTWYWDGTAWNLLPPSATNGNDTNGGGMDTVPATDHFHDTPRILDDLLDVEIEEPEYSSQYDFYINVGENDNENPNVENAWGRYSVNVTAGSVTFHTYDLNGKELEVLYNFTNKDITTHKYAAFDLSYSEELKVTRKLRGTNSFTFFYEDRVALAKINNDGNSKLFGLIAADYKRLSDGAILVYRQNSELWRPEPNPDVEAGNKITISFIPPVNSGKGDIWVDEETFYIYIWDSAMWVALTGPEGGAGGGDIAHNKEITFISSRGLLFDDSKNSTSFRINQLNDQSIDFLQKNIVTLDYTPHPAPEVADIWINKTDYHQYVWDGSYWIGISGDDSFNTSPNNRLEQPCRLIGGKPNSLYCNEDGDLNIPPVTISTDPPDSPSPGALWFDSEHLELRVWYVSGSSFGGWVSSTHPGMRPDLSRQPYPDPISLSGPPIAQELEQSNRYVATVSYKILDMGQTPMVEWTSSDKNATFFYKNKDHSIATVKFSTFGNFSVTASIKYYENEEDIGDETTLKDASDTVRTSVSIKPPGDPIRYQVKVIDGPEGTPVFEIDGDRQPYLNLMRNRKYIFDQSHPSNEGYLFRFYEATEYYDTGVIIDSVPEGIGQEYTEGIQQVRKDVSIVVPPNAPIRLRYGSPVDRTMGYWIYPFDVDGSVNFIDPTTIES